MAEKLIRRHMDADDNVYALIFRASDGKVWDVTNNTWQTFADASIGDYDIVGTELGTSSRIYTFDVPTHANFGVGRFTAILFNGDDATPGVGDYLLDDSGSGTASAAHIDFCFDGSKIVEDCVYHAKLELNIDAANSKDEWTVVWFRNGVAVAPTSPTIQVIKRADGTDLVASTALTQVGSTLGYKKDTLTTERTTAGEAVVVKLAATIDGATRTWYEHKSRDN